MNSRLYYRAGVLGAQAAAGAEEAYPASGAPCPAVYRWGAANKTGGDNPCFSEQMHQLINDPANRGCIHRYFDVQAGDGHHQLSPGLSGAETNEFPRAAAQFKELFGGGIHPRP